MWLFYSLLAPLFFAIVHVMDSYCVEDIFEKPWMGMVTSAAASIIVFLPLPYILPLLSWETPSATVILMALLSGALIQFSQGLYFQSLSYSEAGIVASYWNMIPAIIVVISYVFFGESLSFVEYIGIGILVSASTYILLADENFEFRAISFLLMLAASIMQAVSYITLDKVYEHISFGHAFMYVTAGLVLAGLSPLLIKNVRVTFKKSAPVLNKGMKLFLAIEIVNLLALACAEKAIALHEPGIVAAVETTIPAFTFAISIVLLFTTANKFGDERSKNKFFTKIAAVGLMTIGVILVS